MFQKRLNQSAEILVCGAAQKSPIVDLSPQAQSRVALLALTSVGPAGKDEETALRDSIQEQYLKGNPVEANRIFAEYVLGKRQNLWVSGTVNDIARGNYYSYYNFDGLRGKSVFEQDGACSFEYGLDQNIYLQIGEGDNRSDVLVMDNHNYALPFILEMSAGVTGLRMNHVDDHIDMVSGEFDIRAYRRLPTDDERMLYFLTATSVSSWQKLLMDAGLVDAKHWQWARYVGKFPEWQIRDRLNRDCEFRDFSRRRVDIDDTDIDYLIKLDEKLTEAEKAGVLIGDIPAPIAENLRERAQTASRARIITIATSPHFIDQERAIAYTKELVRQIQLIKGF